MIYPNRITVRIVHNLLPAQIIVEHDGTQVVSWDQLRGNGTDIHMKGIELVLASLGYVPDLSNMYMDDALTVLEFNKPTNGGADERDAVRP